MRPITLLIVDKDKTSRLLLEETIRLAYEGILDPDVISAEDDKEAFHLLEKHDIDLVITEIRLNGNDGLRLTKSIKSQYPHLKVIIQTGAVTDHLEKQIKVYGADAYITKPIDIQLFSKKLREFF